MSAVLIGGRPRTWSGSALGSVAQAMQLGMALHAVSSAQQDASTQVPHAVGAGDGSSLQENAPPSSPASGVPPSSAPPSSGAWHDAGGVWTGIV